MDKYDLILPWDAGQDPAFLRTREWLVTNGLGGFASGSIAGIPTRKYHGLFVPNLAHPKGRHVMISRCDEMIVRGEQHVHLGGAEFEHERFTGESPRYLRQFRLHQRIAVWLFDLGGVVLQKSISLPHNQNIVCVRYELLEGEPVELHVRPFMAFRRVDATPTKSMVGRFTLNVSHGRHEVRLDDSPLRLRMGLRPTPAVFVAEECEELDFFYRVESDRGDPPFESAYSPGYFHARLEAGRPLAFLATTQSWEALDADVEELFQAEHRRMSLLLSLAPELEGDPFAQQLAMAADQFIVLPGSRLEENVIALAEGSELRTVIAGYHWFCDWGRDTMISLEGLTLCTGRYREAGAILRTFSHYVKDGLLPNLFPEGEREALYHTVDATLWYFHALARYVQASGDDGIIVQLFPVLESIVEHYLRGTHYGIHVDHDDGLVAAGAEGYQLTWMDAKVDDWVVTPRRGKPVEIQALWYNALRLMSQWSRSLGKSPARYDEWAERALTSFNERYWNDAKQCLLDVLDGPGGNEDSIRPNQIFAISLDHPVLDPARWRSVVDVVERKLVTPYGLRTLSPDHPDYKTHYRGDLRARDAAYHQGTVWPWLLGHFIDAHLRVHQDKARARRFLEAFPGHLLDAGIGSISEIFDAEPPFAPGGCIAQAWSVAEILRAWLRTRS
jgi:predicted glycogen debranching enzyme